MAKYVLKRLILGVVALFALATITFFLIHAISDTPFDGQSGILSSTVSERVTQQYKLNDPLHVQYLNYLGKAVRGDFGTSMSHGGRDVSDVIKLEITNSFSLGFVAFCLASVVGVFLGIVSVFSKRRWVNAITAVISTIGSSLPSFLLALLMMLLFGVSLRWLPIVGLSSWRHYIMPVVALSLAPIAMITRLTRTSLTEVMDQDYITLARSKGTGSSSIILRHALKNALPPVITYAGPLLATLLTGSFVIETIFSIPGIGSEFVTSISNRDYPMIMALTTLYGTLVIVCNLATDLITAALDPRVRLK